MNTRLTQLTKPIIIYTLVAIVTAFLFTSSNSRRAKDNPDKPTSVYVTPSSASHKGGSDSQLNKLIQQYITPLWQRCSNKVIRIIVGLVIVSVLYLYLYQETCFGAKSSTLIKNYRTQNIKKTPPLNKKKVEKFKERLNEIRLQELSQPYKLSKWIQWWVSVYPKNANSIEKLIKFVYEQQLNGATLKAMNEKSFKNAIETAGAPIDELNWLWQHIQEDKKRTPLKDERKSTELSWVSNNYDRLVYHEKKILSSDI